MGQGGKLAAIDAIIILEGFDVYDHQEIRVAGDEAAIGHGWALDDGRLEFVENLLGLRAQFDPRPSRRC